MNWFLVAFGAVFAVLGSILLLAMPREFALLRRMRREGVETTGVVVRHVRTDKGIDRPVIQFTDRRGQLIEFSPDPVRLNKFVMLGKHFPVTYLEDRPNDARLAGSETRRRGWLITMAVGALFLGLGVVMMSGVLPNETVHVQVEPRSALGWLFAVGMILGCGFPVFLLACSLSSLLNLRRDGVHTTGTVLRVYKVEEGSRGAVVEFFDLDGRRVQCVCRGSKRLLGKTVPVVYPPDSPEDAQRDTLTPVVVPLVVLSLFGFAVLWGLGYVLFFK